MQRSVNRKVQGSNPWSGANIEMDGVAYKCCRAGLINQGEQPLI